MVRIGMLGPLEVRTSDGTVVEVPGARLRGLLAGLALEADRVVSKRMLVDWLWGAAPRSDMANALQRLVCRLRKVLPGGLIEGRPDGYRLLVDPDAVDAVRFERLVGRAREQQDPRLLREALGLWRGAALQDVGALDGAGLGAAAARLEGLRLAALEDRFDTDVRLGHGVGLVGELTDLVAAHPVRERLVGALMRALAAAGRSTDALLAYQRLREVLADRLGVDPSPDLSALHVALLRGELVPGQRAPRPAGRITVSGQDIEPLVVGGQDAGPLVVRGPSHAFIACLPTYASTASGQGFTAASFPYEGR